MIPIALREIPFSTPDITNEEIKEVKRTLKSGWITTGPKTKLFEQKLAEYIGVSKAVCLNSASSALELTLRILGIGPGDEVITTVYTYTASASVIQHVGAKIVLIDVAKDSYEMDYSKLENAISERTKVIIPVDIAGKMCNYDQIFHIIENKKSLFHPNNEIQKQFQRIIVLGDSSHGLGAEQNFFKSGQVADFTCFSFHAVKNLTTGEGGAVVWKKNSILEDSELYKQYMLLSLHGQSKDALSKSKSNEWEYDILYPAYKANMTDIMAAIGLIQLKRYEKNLKRRRDIMKQYDSQLKPLGLDILKHSGDDFSSSGHLYMIRIPGFTETERNQIIIKMGKAGIACNVHYKPLAMLTAYKNMGFRIEDFPNAFHQYQNEITIPLHTLLSDDDVHYVCKILKQIIRNEGI